MLDEYAMKGHTHNEAIFFKAKKPKKYIVFHKKSKDPFSAVDSIKDLIIDNVSIYRMFDHNYPDPNVRSGQSLLFSYALCLK